MPPRKAPVKLAPPAPPPAPGPNAKSAEPTDIYCGQRVRLARRLIGASQEQLADAIGVSFQQVQKYENGMNRISISRLIMIANFLHRPVGYFFDGMPGAPASAPGAVPADDRLLTTFESAVIARLLTNATPATRQRAVAVVKALTEADVDA